MAGRPDRFVLQNPPGKMTGNAPPGFASHLPSIRNLLLPQPVHLDAAGNPAHVSGYSILPDRQAFAGEKYDTIKYLLNKLMSILQELWAVHLWVQELNARSKIMSCQDLEHALLSRSGSGATEKLNSHEIQKQAIIKRQVSQDLHPTIPSFPIVLNSGPPPGFGSRGGPIFMSPIPRVPLSPIARPPGLLGSSPPQPHIWSPARQATRKQEENASLLTQKVPQLKKQQEDECDNAIRKKLQELSLRVQNVSGNVVNHFHSLEHIEQEVLNNQGSSKKNFKSEESKEVKKKKSREKRNKDQSIEKKNKLVEIGERKIEESYLDKQNVDHPLTSTKEKENENGKEVELKKKKKANRKKTKKKTDLVSNKSDNKSADEDILVGGVFSQAVVSEDGTVVKSKTQEKRKSKKKKPKSSEEQFEPYLSEQVVKAGIRKKTLIQGEFRINIKNYLEAFITDCDSGQDILIMGLLDRNRALDGDIVAVQVKDEDQWQEQKVGSRIKTGKVVSIVERVHRGQTIGSLQLKGGVFMLIPRDSRFPLLKIPSTSIPPGILNQFKDGQRDTSNLYMGFMLSWNLPRYANGMIKETVGKKGDIAVETDAIFAELGLDKNPIPSTLNRFLPSLPYEISAEEISSRLDLRSEVIFTIDPPTARDLDDAVSIKKLSEGVYEVGVHISDVTHFLKEGTPLDIEVSERATTVYMVERAYHMLPLELCGLCSLLPGEDKLAVSVIFKLDEEGNVLDTKFARTVLNSCAQLSYDHAQALIDGEDIYLPTIHNDVPISTIKEAILELNKIAVNRRKRRFDNGALKIDQPKVCFDINSDCVPQTMYIYELKDSNRLIEEFMLLANEAVATYIHSKFPEVALLRRHDPPKEEMMNKVVNSLQKLGIFLDLTCAGSLYQTLTKYINGDVIRATVLNQLCAKPMNRAMYFCCSDTTHHYALNVDKYTHFTSPIRRYADIVVHRVLTACLGYTELPSWTKQDVCKFATTSNRKKYAAKKAGDLSSNFFRTIYIKSVGEVITEAVVTWVNSRSVDTTIPSMALNIRVYLEKLEYEYIDNDIGSSLIVKWPGASSVQVLQVFCVIKISLRYSEKTDNLEAKLLPPEPVEELQSPSDHLHELTSDIGAACTTTEVESFPQNISDTISLKKECQSSVGEKLDLNEENNYESKPLLVSAEKVITVEEEPELKVSEKQETDKSLPQETVMEVSTLVEVPVEVTQPTTDIQISVESTDLVSS